MAGGPIRRRGYCTAANPNCYDPFAPPSANNSYNWNSQTKDTTWMLGVGADWQAMESAQADGVVPLRVERGQRDVRLPDRRNHGPARHVPLHISNFDNSKQQYFNLKGVWNYDRNWSFTGGYSYMKFSHDDIATNGYQYALPIVTNSGAGGIVPTSPTSASLSYGNGYDAYTGRSLQHLLRGA